MATSGAVLVSCYLLRDARTLSNCHRPLLLDDGRSAAGLLCLPAGALPSVRPKGKNHSKQRSDPHQANCQQEPKLWYGIGILYDRYGSLEHAEEAFSQVMRMEPTFEKANEIYFRLGIIYKQQQKFNQSLDVSICPYSVGT
jgi:tetratricopeptide (TPR) repeat protein